MSFRTKWILGLAAAVLAGTGSLLASNMAFQLNYPLTEPLPPVIDGTNTLTLPFLRKAGIDDANALGLDIGGWACTNPANPVINLQRYDRTVAGLEVYDGCFGTAFALQAGESYRVKVNQPVNYVIVGSHDPGQVVSLIGPGAGSLDGTNSYGYPYHSTASDARELGLEIGGFECVHAGNPVVNIQVYNKVLSGLQIYDGCFGSAFPLSAGQGYRIKVNTNVSFIPMHY